MDITKVLNEYKQTKQNWVLSDKQKHFVLSLINQIYSDQAHFKIISNLMNQPITEWIQLSSKDVRILISKLLNRKPISPAQLVIVEDKFSLDHINTKFKTDFTNLNQLNNWHVKRLFSTVNKFNLRPNDHPIKATIDYEYGYQDSFLCQDNKMYYLKLYNLMMLDYDDISYSEVIEILTPYLNNFCFKIYQTYNGYHVFIMSRTFNYGDPSSTQLMKQLNCDDYYVMFCHKNGYKIRLSPKLNRDEPYLAKYIGMVGNKELMDLTCEELINIHDKYILS